MPNWLETAGVPLFISHRTLMKRKTLPVAVDRWALDSGAFTEIATYGKWKTTVPEYVEAVHRYSSEIGQMDWAAPMDWMCEPEMIEKTGLSVREHQYRTVQNFLEIKDQGPFIPALQGQTVADYERHVEDYRDAGINLEDLPTVGLGSVCRRQATTEIGLIVRTLAGMGLNLHGFGVKLRGLAMYGTHLTSADSLAWSFNARMSPPMPGHSHKSCANCQEFALRWRRDLLSRGEQLEMEAAYV